MQIKFELEKKDILAFHLYTLGNNKNLRIIYLICLMLPTYLTLSPFFQWLILDKAFQLYGSDVIFNVALMALANFAYAISLNIGFFVAFNSIYLFFLMHKYKQNDGSIGQHLIELRENHLLEATDVNETLHSWKSIQKIIDWRNYILIYVSPTNAHIIPKRYFESAGNVRLFLDEVNRLKESAATSFSPSYLASKD